jgi:hypothetical protein
MGDYYGVYSDAAKSPKKATMIGEEYEALLQSAFNDTRGEDEIGHFQLAPSLRVEMENLVVQLLKAHDQEAGYRSTYQHLLREQAVAKGLLEKIQTEAAGEHERGTSQVEELEQQISDLEASNFPFRLPMMEQK